MNIFIFDQNLKHSAEYFFRRDPTSARKQIVEAVQMIAMASSEFGWRELKTAAGRNYKWTKAQYNHPCTKWVRENPSHILWLASYVYNLELRYFLETKKHHESFKSLATALAESGRPIMLQPKDEICPPFLGKEEFLTHPVDLGKLDSVYEKYWGYLENKLWKERGDV